MIEAFKDHLVTTLATYTGAGEHLEGITVLAGDVIPETRKHPAITVDWDGVLNVQRQKSAQGRVRLSADFRITLYVSRIKGGLKQAHTDCNNLLLRAGETQFLGLHPLLSRLSATANFTDSLNNDWAMDLQDEADKGVVSSPEGASVAAAYTLTLWTVIPAAQY